MKKEILPLFLVLSGILCSCQGENHKNNPAQQASEPGQDTATVTISMAQFQAAGMETGVPREMQFSNQVNANGYIRPSAHGMAAVSTPVPGRVTGIFHGLGDRVQKGTPLFRLESNEIVALQEDYAEAYQQLDLLKTEYEKYLALTDEKIVAEKDLRKARAGYETALARSEGLKARLGMLGLDPREIGQGHIRSGINVPAPIGGMISKVSLVMGQYADPETAVMEIIDPASYHLVLSVFESAFADLKPGQPVGFHLPGKKDLQYGAVLRKIGQSIDPESRTIRCIAELNVPDPGILVNNLFVEAEITTCQRQAMAVPEQALIKESGRNFVWLQTDRTEDRISFRKFPVTAGMTQSGYTEVMDGNLSGVLLRGASSLPVSGGESHTGPDLP